VSNNTKHDRGEAALLLNAHGVTLMELLVTISILLVLAVVSMPAMKVMSKRTHELELRQRLREIRMALDQFHQDWAREGEIAKGEYCTKNKSSCLDHTGPTGYPKTMDVLLGIELTNDIAGDKGPGGMSGGMGGMGGMGMGGMGGMGMGGMGGMGLGPQASQFGVNLKSNNDSALRNTEEKPKVKRYLRRVPFDPLTSTQEWGLRCYKDPPATERWCSEDVYDVFTKSHGMAIDKSKYREW
jgi:prepilin-type N-terminal cleavage/methylation domain-containing protein